MARPCDAGRGAGPHLGQAPRHRPIQGTGRRSAFHEPWPDRIEGEEHGDVEYAQTIAEWKAGASAGT
jgi:hypothetical protein